MEETVTDCSAIHPHSALLLFRTDEELAKVERLVHNMVERAQRMDGTATGEHGVGIGKKVRGIGQRSAALLAG